MGSLWEIELLRRKHLLSKDYQAETKNSMNLMKVKILDTTVAQYESNVIQTRI
jgi:hypothetical protein